MVDRHELNLRHDFFPTLEDNCPTRGSRSQPLGRGLERPWIVCRRALRLPVRQERGPLPVGTWCTSRAPRRARASADRPTRRGSTTRAVLPQPRTQDESSVRLPTVIVSRSVPSARTTSFCDSWTRRERDELRDAGLEIDDHLRLLGTAPNAEATLEIIIDLEIGGELESLERSSTRCRACGRGGRSEPRFCRCANPSSRWRLCRAPWHTDG